MASPLVSVVLPTYNRAYCLGRAIDSVLSQSHTRLEVIVVDDGSTDDTAELVDRYRSRDRRIVYVAQPNAGVSAARNAGIRASSGSMVAFLDSDDAWLPWKLEAQVAVLQALGDVGMVWSDMAAVDANGAVLHERYLEKMYDNYERFPKTRLFAEVFRLDELVPTLSRPEGATAVFRGDIFTEMVFGNLVHTSTVLIKRSRLERAGGFDESLHHTGEDYDFHLRTCREGPVTLLDAPTIRYRIGMQDQLTRPGLTVHMAHNFLRTLEHTLERDRERLRCPPEVLAAALARARLWVARAYFEVGDYRAARSFLRRALRAEPAPGTALLWLVCHMPAPVIERLRAAYRGSKRVLGVDRAA